MANGWVNWEWEWEGMYNMMIPWIHDGLKECAFFVESFQVLSRVQTDRSNETSPGLGH